MIDMPVLDSFYGRVQELSMVQHWIQDDFSRIIIILGGGGASAGAVWSGIWGDRGLPGPTTTVAV